MSTTSLNLNVNAGGLMALANVSICGRMRLASYPSEHHSSVSAEPVAWEPTGIGRPSDMAAGLAGRKSLRGLAGKDGFRPAFADAACLTRQPQRQSAVAPAQPGL